MKIKGIISAIAVGVFAASPAFAAHVDNIFIQSDNGLAKVLESHSVDSKIAVTRVNDTNIRISRPHFSSGYVNLSVGTDWYNKCNVVLKSAHWTLSVISQQCTGNWEVVRYVYGHDTFALKFRAKTPAGTGTCPGQPTPTTPTTPTNPGNPTIPTTPTYPGTPTMPGHG